MKTVLKPTIWTIRIHHLHRVLVQGTACWTIHHLHRVQGTASLNRSSPLLSFSSHRACFPSPRWMGWVHWLYLGPPTAPTARKRAAPGRAPTPGESRGKQGHAATALKHDAATGYPTAQRMFNLMILQCTCACPVQGCCALSCGEWHTARPCEPDQFVAVSIQVYVCWVFSQKRNAAAMQCREQANDGASHKTTCARKSNPRKALHRRDLVWWRVRCTPVQPSAWAWHQCLNDKECDRRCPADRGSFKAPASCARHLS